MKKVFEEVKIGSIILKNRLMVSAMDSNYIKSDGCATEQFEAYIAERAKGGWGLIVTEMCNVMGDSKKPVVGLYNDMQVESYKKITAQVHDFGSKIFVQLFHPGRRDSTANRGGIAPLAPSAIAAPGGDIPHEMTIPEIEALVEAFGDAAVRAKKAGFDGVEIHCGHGWLLSAFLSPISNRRTDIYGGSTARRTKVVVDIIHNIKEKVGNDYPVTMKFSVAEYLPGGMTLAEAKVMAKIFEKAGIDAIHCTQGMFLAGHIANPPAIVPKANYIENAKAIKSVVSIPVIAVGRLNDPQIITEIIEDSDIDVIAMGRGSLADPYFPIKMQEGREDDIVRCVGCSQGCIGAATEGKPISCLANPLCGREWLYAGKEKTKNKKKVYIAGGGVSGCMAAITAAENGHDVTLFEKETILGGQWRAAIVPVGKEEFSSLLIWQRHRLDQLGVKVQLNQALTGKIVKQEKPDVVLVATGGVPFIPPIKGINSSYVVTAVDVLLGRKNVGKKVLVIGGGLVGAEVAEHLALYHSQVTIVEMGEELAVDAVSNVKFYLMENLKKAQVNTLTSAKVVEIAENKVILQQDGAEQILEGYDTIVLAAGTKSENSLLTELSELEIPVIAIGDAAKTKDGLANILEGFEVAHTL